jgi:hypothetical protein
MFGELPNLMDIASLRKFGRQIVRALRITTHIALICVLVAYAPTASSVQIVLGTAMKVRSSGEDGLTPVGVLRRGSIVEVPDRFKVMKNGKVDAEATFDNWLRQAGYTNSQINRRVRDQKQDFYYPIRIVSVAGHPKSRLKGRTLFMALRVLERSHGGLRVKEDAPAYSGSSSLQPLRGLPRLAPVARPAQPAARSAETTTRPQDEPPVYRPPVPEEEAQEESRTEGTDSSQECVECQLQQPQSQTEELARTAREQVATADRISSRGLQGLPSQFPANCRDGRFINGDGSYGPLGAEILKQLRRHPNEFLSNGAARGACPNFDSWVDRDGRPDEARRYHFWVYLMTAVFAKESTCRNNAPAMGPHGALAGLGQMPADQTRNANDNRYYGWGSDCSGNMSIASNNIRCSVRRLEAAVDNGRGPYTVAGNYWSTLRSESRGMTKALISQYADCGASSFNVPGRRVAKKPVKRHHGRRK